MKRSLLTLSLLFPSFAYTAPVAKNPEPITLTSEVLSFIDGKKFGIDGDTIVILIRVRLLLREWLLGVGIIDENQKICTYMGKHYTIKEMAVLEQKLRESGELKHDAVYLALGESLSEAKRALLEKIAIPLLDRLRKGKKYTVQLIQESCEKHNRNTSILLEWAKTDDDHEIEVFMNKIDSFKALGLFCLDLIHLIGDIIHSCPIAYKQFEEMKQQYEGSSLETLQ